MTPENLLETYIQHWLETGKRLPLELLCEDSPHLEKTLSRLVNNFHKLESSLQNPADEDFLPPAHMELPDGYAFIETLGEGGFGTVVKAKDVELDRVVAIKLLKRLSAGQVQDILKEARILASLDDPAIVRVYAVDQKHAAIIMEYVEGFDPIEVCQSLDVNQIFEIMQLLVGAVGQAHAKGILHRDIKPSNIKLTPSLQPKLLDFGLAQYTGEKHHGYGTFHYAAPELFDQNETPGPQSDIYALGVIFYEMLCGRRPFDDVEGILHPAKTSPPRLLREFRSGIPKDLQSIVLKTLEKSPEDRYPSAEDLAEELIRFQNHQPVRAKPTCFAANLEHKIRGHLNDLRHWEEIGLVYDHERQRISQQYQKLSHAQDDWILESRLLTYDQIVLYLGVFTLFFGTLCLFFAHHFLDVTIGLLYPAILLGGTSFALLAFAQLLHRSKTVSVAYDLAASLVLPLFLLTLFRELGWFDVPLHEAYRLFPSGIFSEPQLQITFLVMTLWALKRALSTHTISMGTMAACSLIFLLLALELNIGLKKWVLDSDFHYLSYGFLPVFTLLLTIGIVSEYGERTFLARPFYSAATLFLVCIPELLALNGKALAILGLSSTMPAEPAPGYDPAFLDTLLVMACNGILIYWVARQGMTLKSPLLRQQANWLIFVSPFLILEPLAILVSQDLYGVFYHWLYLAVSLLVLFSSHRLQRKAFYFAGLFNTILALFFITNHYEWLEKQFWPITLLLIGLSVLACGYVINKVQMGAEINVPEKADE